MRALRQGTAVNINSLPVITVSTGALNAGATIQKAGVLISKAGGVKAAANSDQGASDAGAVYQAAGVYIINLNTTDTGTLGQLDIMIAVTLCTPIMMSFMVIPALVWDALYGTEKLPTDTVKWNGTAVATPTTAGVPRVDVKAMEENVITAAATAADAGVENATAVKNVQPLSVG